MAVIAKMRVPVFGFLASMLRPVSVVSGMALTLKHAFPTLLANRRFVVKAAEVASVHIWFIDIGVVRALQTGQ